MDTKRNAYIKHKYNLDITNPRNWYSLLSEKLRAKNGAIEYSHPNDNTFLPQLAEELGLCGERPCVLQRQSITNSRRPYQPPTKLCKETTLSTLFSFYKKEFPEALKTENHVKFVDEKPCCNDDAVSLPKLPSIQNNIGASNQSILSRENVYHSHLKNMEDWFSQMPDAAITKAKRKIMEQSIREYVSNLDNPSSAPLPMVDQLRPNETLDVSLFPTSNYLEIQNDQKNILDRKIYRMQLKSILNLNYAGVSILDKTDVKKRDVPSVPTFHKANEMKDRDKTTRSVNSENNDMVNSDSESELGFDIDSCPLYIVNTKRNIQIEPKNEVTKSTGAMPCQKKLKRLRKYTHKQTKDTPSEKITSEKGVIVLSLDHPNQQRDNKYASQQINTSADYGIGSKNDCLVDQIDMLTSELNKTKALQVNYNKLEVFSENKLSNELTRKVKLIDITNKREVPKCHPPVYKLDQRQMVYQRKSNQRPLEMDNIVPIKIVKDVVIVGSPETNEINDVNTVNSD